MRIGPRFSLKLLVGLLIFSAIGLAFWFEFLPRYRLYQERLGIVTAIRNMPKGVAGIVIQNHADIDDARDMSWVEKVGGKTFVNLVFLKKSDWYLVRFNVETPDDFTAYQAPSSNMEAYRVLIRFEDRHFFGANAQLNDDIHRGQFWFTVDKFNTHLEKGTLEESGFEYAKLQINSSEKD